MSGVYPALAKVKRGNKVMVIPRNQLNEEQLRKMDASFDGVLREEEEDLERVPKSEVFEHESGSRDEFLERVPKLEICEPDLNSMDEALGRVPKSEVFEDEPNFRNVALEHVPKLEICDPEPEPDPNSRDEFLDRVPKSEVFEHEPSSLDAVIDHVANSRYDIRQHVPSFQLEVRQKRPSFRDKGLEQVPKSEGREPVTKSEVCEPGPSSRYEVREHVAKPQREFCEYLPTTRNEVRGHLPRYVIRHYAPRYVHSPQVAKHPLPEQVPKYEIPQQVPNSHVQVASFLDASVQVSPIVINASNQHSTVNQKEEKQKAIGQNMRDWKPLDMKGEYQRREKTPTDLVRILTTQLEDLKMHLGEHVRDTIFDNVDALAASLFGISESMVQQMKNEEETKEETN